MTRRILVVGGTRVLGARLVTGILATTEFNVIVAGRDRRRCAAFIARQNASTRARLSVAVIDTGTVTARDLVMTGAFVVVDAVGPYQGRTLYLPRAAIEARIHYLDFVYGRDFVRGIAALDAAARAAGVAVLAGASSTPALTRRGVGRAGCRLAAGGRRGGHHSAGQLGAAGSRRRAIHPVLCRPAHSRRTNPLSREWCLGS
ncbi:MAG: saccharopine dehydrogenase NADP-binding domain-containing protein [Janthinobacterium lividum]